MAGDPSPAAGLFEPQPASRLVRVASGPQLARRGKRLVARPQAAKGERADVDVAALIEEERDRFRGANSGAARG